jgi:hypothetical protein
MTVLEEGLYSYLTAAAGITALVSTRVYAFRIPQHMTLPCLTYQRISTARVHTHDTSGSTGLARSRFQFDAWADSYDTAKDITDALRAALNGKTGTLTGTYAIQAALVEEESPELDPQSNLYRSRSDYMIWVSE